MPTTNAITAQRATQKNVALPSPIHVLGIAGPDGDLRALLRQKNGTVFTVRIGDKTPFGQVVGINERDVVLANKRGTRRLSIPAPTPTQKSAA